MESQNQGTKHLTIGLLVVAMGLVVQCTTHAQTIIPGYRFPLVSTLPTPANFRSHLGGPSGAGQSQISDDIKELARALKYDPALMYKFVHDYIDYELAWGDIKGSHMTWMDRSGNAFDQASLMIDLLQEANTHNEDLTITNINYVVGEIQLTSQIYQWLGIDYYDYAAAEEALARAGLYGNLDSNGLRLIHVWVKATVNGQNYEFDPSFKAYSHSVGMFSMNNYLELAMHYDDTAFMSSAMSGSTPVDGGIMGINKANIQANLNTYTSYLTDKVKDEAMFGDITLKDVIGGKTINAVAEAATLPTAMPYTIISRDNIFPKSSVPNIYRTTLNLQYNGINKTLNSSDIYGRTLTLSFNGSNQPVLKLDGTTVVTGNACTPGAAYNLVFTVDHPDEYNSFAKVSTLGVRAGGFYSILNGWGQTGTHILAKYRQSLNTVIDQGSALNSEAVLGRSYTLAGLSWMAQTSKMRDMASQIKSGSLPHRVFNQHVLGVAGQYDTPYLDLADNTYTIANQNSEDSKINALFFAIADFSSLYLEKTIQQLQGDTGVSAVSLLTMGNDRTTYNKTFSIYHSGFEPQLVGYSQAEKDLVSAYYNAGYTIAYPQYGDLTSGSWSGMGLDARKVSPTELTAVHLITGAHGASCTSGTTMNVNDLVALTDSGVYKQQDGVETAGSTDLSIGTGSLPFGLTLSRSYSSVNRLKDGPLGKGWTHNFDISIKVLSDSFKALESGSVYDQIPQIVGLYVSFDIYRLSPTWVSANMVSKLTSSWLGDALTDNKVLVRQGSGGFSFGKAVDGSYNPPVGTNMKLTTEPDGSFRLKDTSGKFYDFDTSGRMQQWSDAYGNVVDWTYTANKLSSVITRIGGGTTVSRSMTFTYTGDRITSVQDSASRSIAYGYDAKGQLISHTNPDGKAVTYAYAAGFTGLLTQVFSPDNPSIPVSTTLYDTLGRVTQKTNAVGSAWNYLLAYYRAETELPPQLDPDGNMKRYSSSVWLDKHGQPILAKDIMGRETTYSFDGIYRPTQIMDPSGMATQYQYNSDNQVTSVISSAVSGSGYADLEAVFGYDAYQNSQGRYFLKSNYTRDPAANETIYEYDFDNITLYGTTVGNLRKITYPEIDLPTGTVRPTETFTYNSYGQLLTKTEKDGTVTRFEYFTASQGAGLKKTIADYGRLNLTSECTYDTAGRVITSKDPLGNITQTEYYASGLVKKVIPPAPYTSQYLTYEYYPSGLVHYVKQQTPQGVVFLQDKTYTTIGQLASVRGPYPANATTAQKAINYTQYLYDPLGRPWKVTDAEGHVTETRYMPDGKTWKVIDPDNQAQMTYTYNENGQVSEVMDAKGNVTAYTYNGFMGRARTTYEDGTYTEPGYNWLRQAETMRTRAGQIIEVEYDEWQRIKRKITPENTITYTYDIMGRVTQVVDNHGTTVNTYDTAGRITQIKDPKNRIVAYQYNAASQRTKLTYPDSSYVTYQYDTLGRSTHIKNASGTSLAQYTYDALSRYQTVTYANGATAQYAYDSASRLLSLTNTTNQQYKYEYTYDKVGNRLSMEVNDSETHTYTYDNLYRVTNANYPSRYSYFVDDTQFQYDAVGNRHAVITTSTENYSVNSLNQYTQVDGNDFTYDDNGNLTDDGLFTYAFDSENRLATVQSNAASNYGPISMAVDSPLEFTTGGDQSFVRTTAESMYDGDSAYSGIVPTDQQAWIETTVQGPGVVTFHSMIDSESTYYKLYLTLLVDGSTRLSLNGNNDTWAESSYAIATQGTHTIRWRFNVIMGGIGAAYIDKVEWEPGEVFVPQGLQMGLDLDRDVPITTSGNENWFLSSSSTYHGYYCLQSGDISDSEQSTLEAQVTGPDTVSFYWKVSSEAYYDYLRFYIDGVQQASISGEVGWQQKSYAISSGTHTLKWVYSKDGSVSSGDDAGCVDYLQFASSPPSLPPASTEFVPEGLQCDLDLDRYVSISSQGNQVWTSLTSSSSFYDNDCAKSGNIYDNCESIMQAEVTGPDTVTFYWKVSSEQYYDYLAFYIDGIHQGSISGEVAWQQKTYTLSSGTHTLKWIYSKDGSVSSGDDAGYVDYLQFASDPPYTGGGSSSADFQVIQYDYDASGRRISKSVDDTTTEYFYDGDHCIVEYGDDGACLRKYIYGPGVDQPIVMIDVADSSKSYYYHRDGLGNVIALSDASRNTAVTYEYSIYGVPASSDPNNPNPYLFTGRRFDFETGLYYYRARMYNPNLGRFLQTDPIGYGDGMNWYGYCGGNPVGRVDPSGRRALRTGFLDMGTSPYLRYAIANSNGTESVFNFSSIDDWIGIMKRTAARNQTDLSGMAGYAMSRSAGTNADLVFWSIQAIIHLTSWEDDFESKIRQLEAPGIDPVNFIIEEDLPSLYDRWGDSLRGGGNNVLYWNPDQISAYGDQEVQQGDPEWYNVTPLVALGHELTHAFQRLCEPDIWGTGARRPRGQKNSHLTEPNAVEFENIVRYAFYMKVPGYSELFPRAGYDPSYRDLASTPTEAWSIARTPGWIVPYMP